MSDWTASHMRLRSSEFFSARRIHKSRIEKLQKLVGATVDGCLGRETATAVSKYLVGKGHKGFDAYTDLNDRSARKGIYEQREAMDGFYKLLIAYEREHGFPSIGRIGFAGDKARKY